MHKTRLDPKQAYFLLCTLRTRGIDAVFEQYGGRQRRTDFRCGQRLGPRDHLIVLQKLIHKPDWMGQADYDQAPSTLMVRELRTGGKILVTTLLCPKTTHRSAPKALFRSRWHVELDLRNIKSTLGMERLSCQTPIDGPQGNVDLSTGLQSHSTDDGSGGAPH